MARMKPPKHQQATTVRKVKSAIMARREMKSMFSGIMQNANRGRRTGAAMARIHSASQPVEGS